MVLETKILGLWSLDVGIVKAVKYKKLPAKLKLVYNIKTMHKTNPLSFAERSNVKPF